MAEAPTNLWALTRADWPLSRKFLVPDVGLDALTLPAKELINRLKKDGGVGLIAATQPPGVQCILFDGAVGQYAKYCARPSQFWIYFQCAEGWCRTTSPTWDRSLPTRRVPVMTLTQPAEPLFLGPMCPDAESVARVGADQSLRVMAMLYLTEIYMKGHVFYWKDVRLPSFGELDLSVVENLFGDMPEHRPLLLTVNFAAVLVGADGVVRYFDPVVDTDAMRALAWHARHAGLDFQQVNAEPRPLEDSYYFVAGKVVKRLMELSRLCMHELQPARTGLPASQQPSGSVDQRLDFAH